MTTHDEIQVSQWLRDGIAAAKANQRQEARELLMRVIEVNERSEQAWLWLGGVVDSDEDRLICLENVLTLNPDNVQARAGIKWLHQRGLTSELLEAQEAAALGPEVEPQALESLTLPEEPVRAVPETAPTGPATRRESESFMTPDGCVYCGLLVSESDERCPHCGGRLVTRQFKHEERSALGYMLHAYWVLLAGINMADFFVIGYIWGRRGDISSLVEPYLRYFVGPVVAGQADFQAFMGTEAWVQTVRYINVGLAFCGVLVALGLFLRRPRAHLLGVALVALQLIVGVAMFVLGFLGYILGAFRGLLVVLITSFMFQTVEDFTKEMRRERLEPDRHVVNDVDYYSRGRTYMKRGMWAKALLHWQRATAINPERDVYFGAAARAYARLGRYEQALGQVDQAISVSRTPEDWQMLRDAILQAQRRANHQNT